MHERKRGRERKSRGKEGEGRGEGGREGGRGGGGEEGGGGGEKSHSNEQAYNWLMVLFSRSIEQVCVNGRIMVTYFANR